MSMAINSTLSNYTNSYSANQLKPKLDKDDDGRWSRSEVQNYANSYKKATGNTLDVDKIMSKYAEETGHIDSKSQAKIQEDDALGLSALSNAAKAANTSTSASSDYSLSELMSSMSPTAKASYSAMIQKTDMQSNLISNFSSMNAGSGLSSLNSLFELSSTKNVAKLYQLQMSNGSASNYAAMSNQMLNYMA